MAAVLEPATVIPENDDEQIYRNLERLLQRTRAKLVGPEGQETEIPPKMYTLMLTFAHLLATNKAVIVTAVNKDLTTQQAADLLGVSRPTLVRLLEMGEIPYTRPGTHRRVAFADLMAYQERQHDARARALAALTQIGEEMGGYDVDQADIAALRAS